MKQFCSFSEAIREGIKIRPNQAYFKLTSRRLNASCVVGAGLEAIAERLLTGDEDGRAFLNDFLETIPFPYLQSVALPPCGCKEPLPSGSRLKWGGGRLPDEQRQTAATIFNVAVHLNNHHQWTREAIADWLESEEEKLGFVTLIESESELSKPELPQVV